MGWPALALALWAALVSAELDRASIRQTQNLSCFQCYKVKSWNLCKPTVCPAAARVCVSNQVFLIGQKLTVLISKRCAVRCPNSNSEFRWRSGHELWGRIVRGCCSGQLCNAVPAVLEALWAPSWWLLLHAVLWALL